MSDPTSIFTQIPDLNYSEDILPTSPEEFEKVIRNRRSVRSYTNEKVPKEVVEKVLEWGLLAANSSNLQAREFYWVQDYPKKIELIKALFSQPAARTAQELIVVVAKLDTWKDVRSQMLDHFSSKENVPASAIAYYKKLVPYVYSQGPFSLFGLVKKIFTSFLGIVRPVPREPNSRADMRVWAVKSAALSAQNIMMGFSAFGYDSCPMEGYDSNRVKKILNLGRHDEVVMVISAGKRDKKGVYGERVRMPREQFIKIV